MSVDPRGVSHVVGYVLLVGVVLTGATVLVLVGTGSISDLQGENDVRLAQQTFEKTDAETRQLMREGASNETSVDIPSSIQGEIEVDARATYRVRVNRNPVCDSGEHPLGSLRYEDGGTVVGYQAGGVWEFRDGGASMRSPPSITYENGRVSLSLPSLAGAVTTNDQILMDAGRTEQAQFESNVSTALFTNLSYGEQGPFEIACNPKHADQITLFINNSQFADAWARYARENFDDDAVEVRPAGRLDPRENLTMTFAVGDVTEANFAVEDLTYNRTAPGSDVDVNATVRNTGGVTDTRTVEFRYAGWNTTTTVTLNGSERRTVTASIPDSELVLGRETIEVDTGDDTESVDLVVDAFTGVPSLDVAGERVVVEGRNVTEAGPGDTIEYVVDLENTGDMTAADTVEVRHNGTLVGTESVVVHPGNTSQLTVPLPDESVGVHPVEVRTSYDTATNQSTVGTGPYFVIRNASAPANVSAGVAFEINATVENQGFLDGSQNVTVRVTDNATLVDERTATLSLKGTGTGPEQADHSLTTSIGSAGTYQYNITTQNASRTGTFTVGGATSSNFVVSTVSVDPNPVPRNEGLEVGINITNAGADEGETEVNVSLVNSSSGNVVDIDSFSSSTLDAGESVTTTVLSNKMNAYGLGTGLYELTVETSDTTSSNFVKVVEPGPGIGSGNGTIVVDRRIDARVLLLGAELEAASMSPNYIIHDPVTMRLQVDNGSEHTIDLWDSSYGGDVNHPEIEDDLLDGREYQRTLTLEPGATVAVHATSYYCTDYDDSGIYWPDVDLDGDGDTDGADADECDSWGSERINVDDIDNSENVAINTSGEAVPAFEQADPYQRGIDDMLPGDRIDANGTLDLEPGERLLLYELSEPNASPANAKSAGDPDYNDAAVLFQTLNINETKSTPPNIKIEDVSVPAQVTKGDTFDLEVTLNNTGGRAGSADVELSFPQGTSQGAKNTSTLDPSETTTLEFEDITTASLSSGTKKYTVNVKGYVSEQSGHVTVGAPPTANFQISDIDAPDVVDIEEVSPSGTPQASITVTNTGNTTDIQFVELVDESTGTVVDTKSFDLDAIGSPGNEDTKTFDLPDDAGTNTYRVNTTDASVAGLTVFVGESEPAVEETGVGVETYGEGELIERQSMPTLSVEVRNTGDVGDEATVNLVIEDKNSGTEVFNEDKTVALGDGRTFADVPGWADFDVSSSLGTGFYTYRIEIREQDDPRNGVVDEWSGEIFLQSDSSTASGAPITVDTGRIRVG